MILQRTPVYWRTMNLDNCTIYDDTKVSEIVMR
jgi:hypothetical protein